LKRFFLSAMLLLAADAAAQPAGARACASCHGARGEGGLTGAPPLAGLPQAYLASQLAAYARGERQHPVMTPIAARLTPQEREALAAYYAGLPTPPTPPQVGERPVEIRNAIAIHAQTYPVTRNVTKVTLGFIHPSM
jgi:cytochrome c553